MWGDDAVGAALRGPATTHAVLPTAGPPPSQLPRRRRSPGCAAAPPPARRNSAPDWADRCGVCVGGGGGAPPRRTPLCQRTRYSTHPHPQVWLPLLRIGCHPPRGTGGRACGTRAGGRHHPRGRAPWRQGDPGCAPPWLPLLHPCCCCCPGRCQSTHRWGARCWTGGGLGWVAVTAAVAARPRPRGLQQPGVSNGRGTGGGTLYDTRAGVRARRVDERALPAPGPCPPVPAPPPASAGAPWGACPSACNGAGEEGGRTVAQRHAPPT